MMYSHAAYRTAEARRSRPPAFKGAPTSRPPRPGGYQPPPRPANDNLPVPANDNRPPVKGWAKGVSRKAAGRLVRGFLRKLDPTRGFAFDVGEQYWRQYAGLPAFDWGPGPVPSRPPGFNRLICNPPKPVDGGPISGTATCLQLQSPPFNERGLGDRYSYPAAQTNWHFVDIYEPFTGVFRWRTAFIIQRAGAVGTFPGALMRPLPTWQPQILPAIWPWVDPLSTPIGTPAAFPEAPPFREIPNRRNNPNRSSTERSSWGPRVARRPGHWPRLWPYQVPAIVTEAVVTPRAQTNTRPRAGGHNLLPPGAVTPGGRVKERKGVVGNTRLGRALGVALRAATEGLDIVDAIWQALPAEVRGRGYMSPLDKAQEIYRHLDEVDLEQAILNILWQQAQDRVIAGAARTRARDRTSRGLGFGSSKLQRLTLEQLI